MRPKFFLFQFTAIVSIACLFVFTGCNNKRKQVHDTIVETPQELQKKSSEIIRSLIDQTTSGNGKLQDSIALRQSRLTKMMYEGADFEPLWCKEEKWLPQGASLLDFIETAKLNGLFPEDYHSKELGQIQKRFYADSLAKNDRRNVTLWSEADIMLTDAFIQAIKDIKLGRLPNDSITLRKDSVLSDEFYKQQMNQIKQSGMMEQIVETLEPKQPGYQLLKQGIKKFLDSASFKEFTNVPSPGKDPSAFKAALQKRLFEEGFIETDSIAADSSHLSEAIKKFQKKEGITVDGKAGEGTVRMLNLDDKEKFIRIAISMDQYKMLPEKMPSKYIWVNLPSFHLQVIEGDSVKLTSKVICGKPKTRTPQLTSAISELITYPQWVPPPSIVQKEILPAAKRSPGYFARKGFTLVDSKGEEVDPYSVDWSKYSKSIPYRVVQGSGDANSLGIMKFVFSNKYSVYLHDTNQRYLFGQTTRSLSHGCVRVQEWEKLAYYIIRNDSLNGGGRNKSDSVKTWLNKKQKHSVPLKNKMPVYIRYITCEGHNGDIAFYDDIYGYDKMLGEKYFVRKW